MFVFKAHREISDDEPYVLKILVQMRPGVRVRNHLKEFQVPLTHASSARSTQASAFCVVLGDIAGNQLDYNGVFVY
jgi:hypothetical protein